MRRAQGNLHPDDVAYIVQNGQMVHNAGAILYFLRQKDIPQTDGQSRRVRRLVNVAVMISSDGEVSITTYRNPNALKDFKKRTKFIQRRS